MKKIIVALFVSCHLLSACASTRGAGISAMSTPPDVSLPVAVNFTDDSPLITFTNRSILVSYILDDEQFFKGNPIPSEEREYAFPNSYRHYDFEEMFWKALEDDSLKDFDIKEMYADDSYNYYYNESQVMNPIRSNGRWDIFPIKIRYEKYTLANQPDRKEWVEYFESQLVKQSLNAPVIFTEAWFFDWNGNGKEDAFVKASNAIIMTEKMGIIYPKEGESHAEPNSPPADRTGMYRMSAVFIDGNEAVNIPEGSYLENNISKKSLNSDDTWDTCTTYFPPADIMQWYQQYCLAVQYNESGEFMLCPVFVDYWGSLTLWEWSFNLEFLLCDIDGDGESELITYHQMKSSSMSYASIYKLIDGKLMYLFSSS